MLKTLAQGTRVYVESPQKLAIKKSISLLFKAQFSCSDLLSRDIILFGITHYHNDHSNGSHQIAFAFAFAFLEITLKNSNLFLLRISYNWILGGLFTLNQSYPSSKVGLLSPPLSPLFQWYLQSNEILLNLSMKC